MGYRIVISDDEPIIRLDLAQMLENLGMEVVGEAADGFDAVECCRALKPDLVLMDISMPFFDGMKATRTLLEEKLAKAVLIVSAFSEPELVCRAAELGVGAYLVKPIEERNLLPAIEVSLAQYRRQQKLEEKLAKADETLRDRAVIDQAKLVIAKENQVTEAEAYRLLQKMAMDKRRPMGVLAQSILEQNEQRSQVNRAKRELMERRGLSEKAAFRAIQNAAEKQNVTVAEAAGTILEGGKTP